MPDGINNDLLLAEDASEVARLCANAICGWANVSRLENDLGEKCDFMWFSVVYRVRRIIRSIIPCIQTSAVMYRNKLKIWMTK